MSAYIILIISFLLENSYSLIFHNQNSLFLSCFSLITIFAVYKLFKGNDKKYFISCFIYGFIYDVVFTGTFFVNALLFLFFSFFISKISKIFQMNLFNIIIVTLCLIILYRLGSYFIFISTFHKPFNYILLFKSFYSSIIINIVYILILNVITSKLTKNRRY